MHRLLIFVVLFATGCITKGASIDDSAAAQRLASCQLHDYGELEIPSEHLELLTSWAKTRSTSGFDALTDHANLGRKALALFDITATDAEYFEISLSAINRFNRESLPESYLAAVLMPSERKRGLIAVNYRDGRLRAVLESSLTKLPSESSLANLIRLTLSGEQAQSVVKHAGDSGYPERYGPLAKIALEGKVPSLSALPSAQTVKVRDQGPETASKESSKVSTTTTDRLFSNWQWIAGAFAALALLRFLLKQRA
jgi:hypothetical protein